MSLMAAMGKPKDGTDKLRQKSTRWSPSTLIRRGRTRSRVLFIDEVHMLDMECFTYLNRSLESPISHCRVGDQSRCHQDSGYDLMSPHGIPIDF
jgi:RuvB-like protein 1 (pontin 52)